MHRDFPRNPPVYLGKVTKGCIGHMICWEADQSTSDWYDKLSAMMWRIARDSSTLVFGLGDAN